MIASQALGGCLSAIDATRGIAGLAPLFRLYGCATPKQLCRTGNGWKPSPRARGVCSETLPRRAFFRPKEAFDNSDHVAIVIHNYRWRLGLAEGEPQYDDLEKRLAVAPIITVPTITLESDANGAPHPDPKAYFSGWYQHRTITGGIGHNLPQEAPAAFAEAILAADQA